MERFVDYYALLGVDRSADAEAIRTAYGNCLSAASFRQENEAKRLYDRALFILGDEQRRIAYDINGDGGLCEFSDATAGSEYAENFSSESSSRHTTVKELFREGIPIVFVWGIIVLLMAAILLIFKRGNSLAFLLFWQTVVFGGAITAYGTLGGRGLSGAIQLCYPLPKDSSDPRVRNIRRYSWVLFALTALSVLALFSGSGSARPFIIQKHYIGLGLFVVLGIFFIWLESD